MRVCVFCGSRMGARPEYRAAAEELGRVLAERGVGLVYGGAHVGLMGALADACLAHGGEVIGVIPRSMRERELAHTGLTEIHVVETMHERKALMSAYAQAFLALPGGMGTWDELCEVLTWAQLGIQTKPIGVLNVAGYYDSFGLMMAQAVREGFLNTQDRERVTFFDSVDAAVRGLVR